MPNPITSQDAILVLRRYQRWRKGDSDKTFDQSGLDVKEIGDALDHVLTTLPVTLRALASTRGQLAKCQVQRERFHAELRRLAHEK